MHGCVCLFATPRTIACQTPLSVDSPGKNTGVVCHSLLQGIFLTQGSNLCLLHALHYRQILYHWATRETLESLGGLLIIPVPEPGLHDCQRKLRILSSGRLLISWSPLVKCPCQYVSGGSVSSYCFFIHYGFLVVWTQKFERKRKFPDIISFFRLGMPAWGGRSLSPCPLREGAAQQVKSDSDRSCARCFVSSTRLTWESTEKLLIWKLFVSPCGSGVQCCLF